MSRPRTATAVLEARGAFTRHPERRRERRNEPQPTGELGPPPKGFDKFRRKLWKELAGIISPGVLANDNRWTVELTVTLMAQQRQGIISDKGRAQLVTLLSKLGMTPADRSKVVARKSEPAKADPWAALKPQ